MNNISPYTRDPVAFIDRFIPLNEKGQPWRLSRHQRRVLKSAFTWDERGRLRMRCLVWGEPKKSGKTFLAGCLVLWWAFTNSDTSVTCAANDLEQSVGRVFTTIVKLLEHNEELGLSAKIRATDIALTNGTTIRGIASDYKGEAGGNQSLSVVDELWGFTLERAERLFEELTPPPTEPNAWVLITTTAGWTGESLLLEKLYQRGPAVCSNDHRIHQQTLDSALLHALTSVLDEQLIADAVRRALAEIRAGQTQFPDQRLAVTRQLSLVEARIRHLVEAIATGRSTDIIFDELGKEEAAKNTLAAQLDGLTQRASLTSLDGKRIERALVERVADVKGLLGRHVPQTRQMLRKLLDGQILCTPFTDARGKGYEIAATGSYAGLFRVQVAVNDGGGEGGI